MYGEFHVRSRGFATLVLEFFLEFAPRSLSLTHTKIFKKNLKTRWGCAGFCYASMFQLSFIYTVRLIKSK